MSSWKIRARVTEGERVLGSYSLDGPTDGVSWMPNVVLGRADATMVDLVEGHLEMALHKAMYQAKRLNEIDLDKIRITVEFTQE